MTGFYIGVLVCRMVATSIRAYAITSVTAEVVEFRYRVNGQYVVPNGVSLAANGRAFLPVRAMGEVFGYMVEFVAESNTIVLNSIPEPTPEISLTGSWKMYFNGELRNVQLHDPVVRDSEVFLRASSLIVLLLGADAHMVSLDPTGRTLLFLFRGQNIALAPTGFYVNEVLRSTRIISPDGSPWFSLQETISALGGQFAHEGRTIRVTFN